MYELRIAELEKAHKNLDRHIKEMEESGDFDDVKLKELKKKKLFLKDVIAELKIKDQT